MAKSDHTIPCREALLSRCRYVMRVEQNKTKAGSPEGYLTRALVAEQAEIAEWGELWLASHCL
jgi:hypothetical protein